MAIKHFDQQNFTSRKNEKNTWQQNHFKNLTVQKDSIKESYRNIIVVENMKIPFTHDTKM